MAATTDNQHAYYISGHGDIVHDTFIVPEGCTIVVKGHSGEKTYNNTLKYMEKMCTLPMETLINPKIHIHDIIHNFGSVEIYNAGDICPDFVYSLVAYYYKVDNLRFEGIGSGLLDIETLRTTYKCHQIPPIQQYDYSYEDVNELLNLLTSWYANSILPTPAFVNSQLPSIKSNVERIPYFAWFTLLMKFKTILDYIRDTNILRYTQSQMCSNFKGTYYNFICRPMIGSNLLFNLNSGNGTGLNIKDRLYDNFNSMTNITTDANAVLKQYIANSFAIRRPLIKEWYRDSNHRRLTNNDNSDTNTWHKQSAPRKGWTKKRTNTDASGGSRKTRRICRNPQLKTKR